MSNSLKTHEGYKPSHPWYYYLGGQRLTLKQIRNHALSTMDNYPFDLIAAEMLAANLREEPRRSHDLKIIRANIERELSRDIARYREVVCELNAHRKYQPDQDPFKSCNDVYTSMSLKFCHLFNRFSQWEYVNQCLSTQPDLFDML